MIRYRAERPGREPTVFIGLSDENVTRLRAGQPIRIKADDRIGLGVELVIYHGATEVQLTRELEDNGILPPSSTAKTEQAMRARGEWRHDSQASR
jgi:hypothetical protein